MTELNFDQICRICLKDSGFYSDIYNEKLSNESLLMELINDLFQLDVEVGDGLPKFLCSDCYNKITDFESFKRFAHEGKAVLQCTGARETCARIKVETPSGNEFEGEFLGAQTEVYLVPTKVEYDEPDRAEKDPLEEESLAEEINDFSSSGDGGTLNLMPSSTEPVRGDEDVDILNEVSYSMNGSHHWTTLPVQFLEGSGASDISVHSKGSGRFMCTHCGKSLATKSNLHNHSKTHSAAEKPFKCSVCYRRFLWIQDLRRHLMTHSGERPFKCHLCQKRFTQNSTLRQHLKTHSGERPFECNICHKRFSKSNNFRRHQMTHTGERPFVCEICEKRFSQKSSLEDHLKTHTGERPFGCDLCKRYFSRMTNLCRHRKTHEANDKACLKRDLCGRKFAQKSSLEHNSKMHEEEGKRDYGFEKNYTESNDFRGHLNTHAVGGPFYGNMCDGNVFVVNLPPLLIPEGPE